MRVPGFVEGSYEAQSREVSRSVTMNLYPEIVPSESAKARGALFPCPGLSDFATLSDSPGRAIFAEESGRLFAVSGLALDEISSAGVVTPRGAVTIDGNPAQMAENGNDHLLIVSGGAGQVLTLSTNVLTAEVSNVTMCGLVDTFFVALDAATGTLKISEASDGTTWDPTQVAQSQFTPWIALLVVRGEMYFFSAKHGEVWGNAGTSPFPFAKRSGAFFETGIEAPWSLAPFGSTLAFLGRSPRGACRVYWMNGYTPMPISTPALEWAIQGYRAANPIDDAIGWSYEALGHSFYVLEFPTAKKTHVFDATTNQWHERGRWSSADNAFVVYRPRFQTDAFDKNIVCDSQSGKLYAFSSTVYTDVGGSELVRLRRFPLPNAEHQDLTLDYLELECERGVGLTTGQGSDPLMMYRQSWDGGNTYGNERTRSLGKRGAYSQRVRWEQCGSGRDPVVEFRCSDPVPVRLFDCYAGLS